jgi:hypothetical protein
VLCCLPIVCTAGSMLNDNANATQQTNATNCYAMRRLPLAAGSSCCCRQHSLLAYTHSREVWTPGGSRLLPDHSFDCNRSLCATGRCLLGHWCTSSASQRAAARRNLAWRFALATDSAGLLWRHQFRLRRVTVGLDDRDGEAALLPPLAPGRLAQSRLQPCPLLCWTCLQN